jgi:hypothetical protein
MCCASMWQLLKVRLYICWCMQTVPTCLSQRPSMQLAGQVVVNGEVEGVGVDCSFADKQDSVAGGVASMCEREVCRVCSAGCGCVNRCCAISFVFLRVSAGGGSTPDAHSHASTCACCWLGMCCALHDCFAVYHQSACVLFVCQTCCACNRCGMTQPANAVVYICCLGMVVRCPRGKCHLT